MQRVGTLTRFGLSGRLGTGGQHWPWIGLADEVGAIAHLLESKVSGAVNLTGPTPATADRVMAAMAERMHRPYTFTVPERMLELALGRAADELLLSSQKVRPKQPGRTFVEVSVGDRRAVIAVQVHHLVTSFVNQPRDEELLAMRVRLARGDTIEVPLPKAAFWVTYVCPPRPRVAGK